MKAFVTISTNSLNQFRGEVMKFETAKKILTKRAEEFYGKTLEWLINQMDNGFDENQTIMKCYKVFKQGKK